MTRQRATADAAPSPGRERALASLPGVCLALAAVHLNAALIMAWLVAPALVTFFYQKRVLATTHTLTLGWISLTIIGVLYRYVPALTKQPVRTPTLARVQVAAFVLGTLGLVAHFWIGELSGMVWSAGVLVASVVLLLACLLPALLRAPAYDATVIGIGMALLSFVAVAVLGLLYGIDKLHPFLGGSTLRNIAAHAHLAVLGWVSVTICAVSYRMVAAFVLPEQVLPAAARRQILSLVVLAPALVAALLADSALVTPLAALTVASLAWYAAILRRLLATRRLPLDWSLRHVQAALVHLLAAAVCGCAFLSGVDFGGPSGTRVAVAYGVFALLGWVTNFILGMATRLVPGLMAVRGVPTPPLLGDRTRAAIFWCFNLGTAVMAVAALDNAPQALRGGIGLTLAATLAFTGAVIRQAGRRFTATRSAPERRS